MPQDIISKIFSEDVISTSAIILAGIVAIFFIVASWAFVHHWGSYGITAKQTKMLYSVYLSVSIFLILAMAISLALFLK